MAHVCYKASSDACHAVAILDADHVNVQQPAHNLVAVQTCVHRAVFCPMLRHQNVDTTSHYITATCNHAHLGTRSIHPSQMNKFV